MKHKILLILVSFLFISCNYEHKNDTNERVTAEELPRTYFKIIRINNHQYLYSAGVYTQTLCHYEDCDYCKKHRNY